MSELLSFLASWFIGLACLAVFIGGFAHACAHDASLKRARKSQLDALDAAAHPIIGRRAA